MRAELDQVGRAVLPVVAGLLLGLLAGGIWTMVQPERHRAEARVVVRGAAEGRAVPAVEALAESSLLEQNVAQTLRLAKPPAVSADADEGGVLTLSVEAGSPERARQLDAEAVQVLTQLVAARFGNTGVRVTVLDPAHHAGQTSPRAARNLFVGGLAGLAGGVAAAIALAKRRRAPLLTSLVDPAHERRLRKRIDQVAKRERALAKRAGELAAREREVEQRVAARRREPATQAEPAPKAMEEPAPQRAPAATGAWTIEGIERLVRERREAFPGRAEEWDTYLFLLREHASIDGSLPRSFDALIDDVFGDALP